MFGRRNGSCAALVAAATLAVATTAEAAPPPVRLHLAASSTCEDLDALSARLARGGIRVDEQGAEVDIDVHAVRTSSGADAELVIRRGTRTATRSLTASTCDEVLDALVFALALALEPGAVTDSPPDHPEAVPPNPLPAVSSSRILWGGGGAAGVFAGASPSAAPALVVHGDVESGRAPVFAPSARLAAAFVLPSSTISSGQQVAFALQTGMLDGCPVRVGGGRVALRPCLQLQVGRLQSRSTGFPGNRLESTPWVALAVALRASARIAGNFFIEVDLTTGSPLIRDVFSVGNQTVFTVAPVLFSASAGVGVRFP